MKLFGYLFFIIFSSLLLVLSCQKEGIKDEIIIELSGKWKWETPDNGIIIFDKENEQFSMNCDRGVIEYGDFSADPEMEFIYITCDYVNENGDDDFFEGKCQITKTENQNVIYISNLPFYRGETLKISK